MGYPFKVTKGLKWRRRKGLSKAFYKYPWFRRLLRTLSTDLALFIV